MLLSFYLKFRIYFPSIYSIFLSLARSVFYLLIDSIQKFIHESIFSISTEETKLFQKYYKFSIYYWPCKTYENTVWVNKLFSQHWNAIASDSCFSLNKKVSYMIVWCYIIYICIYFCNSRSVCDNTKRKYIVNVI